MSERSELISKLRADFDSRTAYIKAKLGILVPSQIRALRLQSEMPRQADLARAAKMQQSRISMFETPGAANVTLETLAKMAAAFKTGLVVKFVPFSEMLRWDNEFSQDNFDVLRIDMDEAFVNPVPARTESRAMAAAAGQGANNLTAAERKPCLSVQEMGSGPSSRVGSGGMASQRSALGGTHGR